MLLSPFNICIAVGFGAHFFMTYFFPEHYQQTIINSSLYAILLYSQCEVLSKKLYYHPNLKPIKAILDNLTKKNEIEVIKFNEAIVSINKTDVTANHIALCDFILFTDYASVTDAASKANKVLFYGIPSSLPLNFDYTICKFTFMSFNVTVEGAKYPIKLSNDSENYYVVGNKINALLVSYLLKKQHNINSVNKYELDIIDHNVNIKNFTEKDELILKENTYIVKPFLYIDTSNMTIQEIVNATESNNE